MQCLRNWATKFQFHKGNRGYTFVELAIIWLSAICIGIIATYGHNYHVSEPLWCIVFIAVGYILIQLGRMMLHYSELAVVSFVFLVVTTASMGLLGYYRTEQSILQYYNTSSFYLNEEGSYYVLTTKDSEISKTNSTFQHNLAGHMNQSEGTINNKEGTSLKTEGRLYGLIPNKKNAYRQFLEAHGHIQIYLVPQSDTTIPAGTILSIQGAPKSLPIIEERGRIDMRGRYMSLNLTGRMYQGRYKIISSDELNYVGYHETWRDRIERNIIYQLGQVRQRIYGIVEENLPRPIATLSEALLLGGHYSEIDQTVMKGFSYTGLIHILSVSGSHIGLLFSLVYGISHILNIRKQRGVYCAIGIVIMYCAIVGFNAPIVRATIMGIIMALGILQGRLYHARQALTITAIGILVFDPIALTDVSFQLSFGATYGLLLFGKHLYLLMGYWPIWVKAPIVLCVSAQLIVLPFQLYYFHFVSVLSLFASIFVAPLLDMAILLLMTLLLVYPVVSLGILWFVLEYILKIALFINQSLLTLPGGYWWIGYMPLWACGVYFGILRLLYYFLVEQKSQQRKVVYVLMCLLMGTVGLSYGSHHFHKGTIIHTIPISQGVALLIMPEWNWFDHDVDSSNRNIKEHMAQNADSQVPMLLMDIPKEKMSNSVIYQLENVIHTYGYTVNDVKKVSFSSKSNFQILYQNESSLYVLGNGQTKKKILKLLDGYMVYIMTSQSSLLHDLVQLEAPNLKGIIYYPPFQKLGDVEPEDEFIHAVRFEYIKDFIL